MNIAYLLLHFPYLSETFVAEEINALRQQGEQVQIISLLGPGKGPVQPLSQSLLSVTRYASGPRVTLFWQAHLTYLLQQPALYLRLLFTLLRWPYPKQRPLSIFGKRFAIFLKAVTAAYLLQDQQIDLIHTHFAWLPAAGAWIAARLLNLPFTVTIHAYELFTSTDLLSLITREAAHIITISDYNKQRLTAAGLRAPDSVSVIHCGVDLSKFRYQPVPARPDAPLKILSASSLNPKKGHPYLIEACKLLKDKDIPFHCNIIGGGVQEPLLKRLIKKYNLQQEVTLLGAKTTPEVIAACREHDLFALACVEAPNGDKDGIPVVLMEAGASGMPLISTQISGVPELVQHQKTGWVAPPQDARALAEGLAYLAQNPAERQRLGKQARRLVEAEFNIEKNAQRIIACMQCIVQGAAKEGSFSAVG